MSIQQYFYMLGEAAVFGTLRGAMLTDSTTTTLALNTETTLSWDTEVNDWGGYFDAGSPTILTVPADAAGWHIVTAKHTHNAATAW